MIQSEIEARVIDSRGYCRLSLRDARRALGVRIEYQDDGKHVYSHAITGEVIAVATGNPFDVLREMGYLKARLLARGVRRWNASEPGKREPIRVERMENVAMTEERVRASVSIRKAKKERTPA